MYQGNNNFSSVPAYNRLQNQGGNNGFMAHIDCIPVTFMLPFTKLESILQEYRENPKSTINVFLDVRSCIPTIYEEATKLEITKAYTVRNDKFVVGRSIIKLINHYARFFRKNNIPYNIILFSESGDSLYHKKLDKDYKSKRKQSKLKAVSYNKSILDNASEIIDYNIKTLETILNKLPRVFYAHLDYLEGDFLPHYIMQKFNLKNISTEFNIILSNDKDLGQSVFDNCIQIARKKSEYKVFDKYTVSSMLKPSSIKNFDENLSLDISAFPLLLAMIGDTSDSVKGLPKVGFVTAFNFLHKLYEQNMANPDNINSIEYLITTLQTYNIDDATSKKIILHRDQLEIALKLVSFDELIAAMGTKYIEQINDVIQKQGRFAPVENVQIIFNTFDKICSDKSLFSSIIDM